MSSGGESLSYFPLSFKEALHLGVINAGMGHQCQELRGRFFEQPIRMAMPVQFLVPAAQFFDRLSNLLGFGGFRDELEVRLELVCGAAVFAVSPIDST